MRQLQKSKASNYNLRLVKVVSNHNHQFKPAKSRLLMTSQIIKNYFYHKNQEFNKNSFGESPVFFLKARLKVAFELKPQS